MTEHEIVELQRKAFAYDVLMIGIAGEEAKAAASRAYRVYDVLEPAYKEPPTRLRTGSRGRLDNELPK